MRNEGDEEASAHAKWRQWIGDMRPRAASKSPAPKTERMAADESVEGRGLQVLRLAEPDFDEGAFLEGARHAYTLILSAFAHGDEAKLALLLGDEILEQFESAIAARTAAGQKLHTEIIALDLPMIKEVVIAHQHARIELVFAPKLVSSLYEQDGNLAKGESDAPVYIKDVWVFERKLGSRDPNWKLIATEAMDEAA